MYCISVTTLELYFFCIVDGANGSSSTSTSASSQGGVFGPNIVMGAFSMPVDVVGATQVNHLCMFLITMWMSLPAKFIV